MGIRETLMDQIKVSMKEKNQLRLDTLRLMQAALKNKEIELRPTPITEDDIQGVFKKLAKQRRESIDQYQNANRQDLADKENQELHIIEEFLPKALSPEKTEELVISTIKELGITQIKEMGKVMKAVIAKSQGSADNKVVNELIKKHLQN